MSTCIATSDIDGQYGWSLHSRCKKLSADMCARFCPSRTPPACDAHVLFKQPEEPATALLAISAALIQDEGERRHCSGRLQLLKRTAARAGIRSAVHVPPVHTVAQVAKESIAVACLNATGCSPLPRMRYELVRRRKSSVHRAHGFSREPMTMRYDMAAAEQHIKGYQMAPCPSVALLNRSCELACPRISARAS